MRKILALAITLLTLYSCEKETHEFTLKGHVKGLKKGVVYLERQNDSTFITLDSLIINGNSKFELHSNLSEPEILFLRLDKNDNDDGLIVFFADKGITEIETSIKNYNFLSKIKGSNNRWSWKNTY